MRCVDIGSRQSIQAELAKLITFGLVYLPNRTLVHKLVCQLVYHLYLFFFDNLPKRSCMMSWLVTDSLKVKTTTAYYSGSFLISGKSVL